MGSRLIRRNKLDNYRVRPPGSPKNRLTGRVTRIIVGSVCSRGTSGWLRAGAVVVRCAFGKSGITHAKREGDGATPAGRFKLVGGYFRLDRIARPRSSVPLRVLNPMLGWCDESDAALYNRAITLPNRARHETLWRADSLYDLFFVLDHNFCPRKRGKGSAIFFHLTHPDFGPTEGCVAIRESDMRRLIPRLSHRVRFEIRGA